MFLGDKMSEYRSSITFLYYKDFDKGCTFIEEVLNLKLVMDQGFAKVYQISETSFLGAVKKEDGSIESDYKGGTLVSLNTTDVESEYERIKSLEVKDLSELKFFEQIPLKSFFFKDEENHDFEIEQFLNEDDLKLFKLK